LKQPSAFDVAVVGGGLVGASFTALLSALRPDLKIALIETFPMSADKGELLYQPSFDARSTAIASGSVDILKAAGVWDALSGQACAIRQVHVSDKGHIGGTTVDADKHDLPAVGYVLENAWMGPVLLRHLHTLDNVSLIAPATVTSIKPEKTGVRLAVSAGSDSQELFVALAVIADGGDSPLRKRLGIESRVEQYHQHAIISNVSFDRSHDHVAYERFTDEGPLALLPLQPFEGQSRSALVWTLPDDRCETLMALSDAEFASALQQRFGFRLGNISRIGKRSAYPLALSTACEQIRSNLVLIGNAAHFLHPVAGQGFNLALRDCAQLCVQLAKNTEGALGSLQSLEAYRQQQVLDQHATIGFSDAVIKLFSRSDLPSAVLRQLGFLGLEVLPTANQLFAEQAMGKLGAHLSPDLISGSRP
jgi:2-polyprenyl-6-methoxyphenol 4-hydroxylase